MEPTVTRFEETQYIRATPLGLVVSAAALAPAALGAGCLVAVWGRLLPESSLRGGAAGGLLALGGFLLVLSVALLAILLLTRLEVVVEEDTLSYRLFPLHRSMKRVAIEQILTADAVTYRPMRDYGGWGIRIGKDGWAYTIGGREGVRLAFRDGTRILLGSRKASAFAEAIGRGPTPP